MNQLSKAESYLKESETHADSDVINTKNKIIKNYLKAPDRLIQEAYAEVNWVALYPLTNCANVKPHYDTAIGEFNLAMGDVPEDTPVVAQARSFFEQFKDARANCN